MLNDDEIKFNGKVVTIRFAMSAMEGDIKYLKSVIKAMTNNVPMAFKFMEENHPELYKELKFKEEKDEAESGD